jgi:hypothetical protein
VVTSETQRHDGGAQPNVTVVFAYYENPEMLRLQWSEISRYPAALKKRIEVIVVDDGSPRFPAIDVPRPSSLPRHSIYRIGRDVRWNQDAARNIGAHEAVAPWLLLTDIDHVVPSASLEKVLMMTKDDRVFYTFGRIKFESGEAREPHPNSYLMARALYWEIGGHDEDFAGIYGKDFLFRKRAMKKTSEVPLLDIPLARVGSKTVGDAGSWTISRENPFRLRVWGYVMEWLKTLRLFRGVQTLTQSYHKVL